MEFKQLACEDFEELWEAQDPARHFHAFIAVHSTKLGPAIGGVRLRAYLNRAEAVTEVESLARAMTYKAAVAGLAHGGAKGVILKPQEPFDRRLLYEAFAEFVNRLQGRYITAIDAGTTSEDVGLMKSLSAWVGGAPQAAGGPGDPSPITALGVHAGLTACVQEKLQTETLTGLSVLVQGLGSVGTLLTQRLLVDGCDVWGSDVRPQTLFALAGSEHFHALLPEALLEQEATVFAPCALGGILNQASIPTLKVSIVAGAANDQLQDPVQDAQALHDRGILYAPDFVINAGGLIHIACELAGQTQAQAEAKTRRIGTTLQRIFDRSRHTGENPYQVALRMAEEKLG